MLIITLIATAYFGIIALAVAIWFLIDHIKKSRQTKSSLLFPKQHIQ